ncbi:MAG: hypothetical protein J3K34DRAFT_500727, partial [Monoraphidium minutum]
GARGLAVISERAEAPVFRGVRAPPDGAGPIAAASEPIERPREAPHPRRSFLAGPPRLNSLTIPQATAAPRHPAASPSMVVDDDASSCDAQSSCCCRDDDGAASAAGALAPALAELIELSLQRGDRQGLSVSARGPAPPPAWRAGCATGGGGGAGTKRSSPEAEEAAAAPGGGGGGGGSPPPEEQQGSKRRAPAVASEPACDVSGGEPQQMACSLASSAELHGTAAAAAAGAARPSPGAAARRIALRPLRLDLAALDAAAPPGLAAAGEEAPATPTTPAEWMDKIEAQLSSRSGRRSSPAAPRAAGGAPAPEVLLPPAFVCLGLISGGGAL